MEFTKEQITKAMECESVEELLDLARAEGVYLSREDAEKYYAQISDRDLTLDDLGRISGGNGEANPQAPEKLCFEFNKGIW